MKNRILLTQRRISAAKPKALGVKIIFSWRLCAFARAFLIAFCLLIVGCQSVTTPKGPKVNVTRVVSGQSLMVSEAAGTSPVRLLGIDAPDLQQHPWGRAAKNRLKEIIKSQPVLLEFDQEAEQDGRRLAYAWTDGVLLNEQLVKEGYALAVPRSPNHKYDQRLERAQEWARLMGQGIWNPENPMRLTPSEFRHQQ